MTSYDDCHCRGTIGDHVNDCNPVVRCQACHAITFDLVAEECRSCGAVPLAPLRCPGPLRHPCPECNGRGVVVDPWDEHVDRCPSCTHSDGSGSPS